MTAEQQRTALEEGWDEDRGPTDDRGWGDAHLLGDTPEPDAGDGEPPVDLADEPEWPGRRRDVDWARVGLALATAVAATLLLYQAYQVLREELSDD